MLEKLPISIASMESCGAPSLRTKHKKQIVEHESRSKKQDHPQISLCHFKDRFICTKQMCKWGREKQTGTEEEKCRQ